MQKNGIHCNFVGEKLGKIMVGIAYSHTTMLPMYIDSIDVHIKAMRKITLADKARVSDSNREHRALLMAMKERDSEKAAELAREHITRTVKNIEAHALW